MNKTLKIAMIIGMMLAIVFTFSNISLAATNGTKKENTSTPNDLVDGIDVDFSTASKKATELSSVAGKVIALIQVASVILAVVLIAVFGFKFIMGSPSEKSEYQKSFIPLIVGLVVVFAATSIAKVIMSVANNS